MDNLTHTLIGVGLAESGLSKRYGRGATWVLALASNLPDLDVLISLTGLQDSFLYRRTFTHSFLGLIIIALLAGFVSHRWLKTIPRRTLFGLWFLGMCGHVFFDLVNSYGVVLLYPFSNKRFELAWIFIIDLVLWALLLVPLIVNPLIKRFRGSVSLIQLWRATMGLVTIYVGICAWGRFESKQILNRLIVEEGLKPNFSYVFPEALGCHRFRGVVKTGQVYSLYQIHLWRQSATFVSNYRTEEETPLVQKTLEANRAQRLMWFAKAPVWMVGREPGSGRVFADVFDLRFTSTVLKPRHPFFSFRFYG